MNENVKRTLEMAGQFKLIKFPSFDHFEAYFFEDTLTVYIGQWNRGQREGIGK